MPKRRLWLRFSLRTLIALVTIFCSWLAWTVNQYRQRKAVVTEIQSAGGTMGVKLASPDWLRKIVGDEEYFYDPVRVSLGRITHREQNPRDDELARLLRHLKQFKQLTVLDVRKSEITDADLELIKDLTNLEVLRLSQTKISDAGLIHLEGLSNLRQLWLSNTSVTDEGIRHLQNTLPECEIAD